MTEQEAIDLLMASSSRDEVIASANKIAEKFAGYSEDQKRPVRRVLINILFFFDANEIKHGEYLKKGCNEAAYQF